jgi:hypothetical protein
MATTDTLREVVRDLLPSGPFWISDAVTSFVNALAGAFVDLVDFSDGLPAAINPRTAAHDVVVDWWSYIRSSCSATPVDTEELRAQVLKALAAPPSYTFAGLQGVVSANVPGIVELREQPAISEVPFDVPGDVNEHARILEVWFTPFLTNEAQLRCVLGVFAQAADTIRLASPDTAYSAPGGLADEQAITWVHALLPMDLAVERLNGLTGATTNALYELATAPHSGDTLDNVLGVAAATSVQEDWFSWHLERDGVQWSPTRTSTDEFRDAFDALTGLSWGHVFFGHRTGVDGALLTLEGTATTADATGLTGVLGNRNRAYDFTATDTQACNAGSIGDISDTVSFAFLLLVKLRTQSATTTQVALGKQDSGGTFTGWNVFTRMIATAWRFRLDPVDPAALADVTLTATSNTLNEWRVFVGCVKRTGSGNMEFASDLEGGTPVAAPLACSIPGIPLRLGDSRPVGSGIPIDGQIAIAAFCEGTQVDGISPQTLAAVVRAALVA